jgi:hypothetical protein
MRIMGTTSLATFLISLIKSHISITCSFSNGQFYCRCYLPLATMLCLTHTHTHSLSVSLLSSSLSPSFCLILKKPGKPFRSIIVLNTILNHTVYISLRGLLTIVEFITEDSFTKYTNIATKLNWNFFYKSN